MKRVIWGLLLLIAACAPVQEETAEPTSTPIAESTATKVAEEITLLGIPTIPIREEGVVEQVVEADTLLVRLDEGPVVRVRLIGVDAPNIDTEQIAYWLEQGWTEEKIRECYNFGNELVQDIEGKRVTLWSDHVELDKDEHDQLLRYVTLDEEGFIVNELLLQEGIGVMRDEPPACSLCPDFAALEAESAAAGRGCLWFREEVVDQVPEEDELAYETGDSLCEQLGCPQGTVVVAGARSDLYHQCNCKAAKWIAPKDLRCYFSIQEAEQFGLRKATTC